MPCAGAAPRRTPPGRWYLPGDSGASCLHRLIRDYHRPCALGPNGPRSHEHFAAMITQCGVTITKESDGYVDIALAMVADATAIQP